jgi:putative endonuclease
LAKGGWVYILSNRRNGTLYVGVTANLSMRVWQHKQGRGGLFTRQYGLTRLVYYEWFDDVEAAIQRESNIKHWRRAWEVRLIHGMNPDWDDLYEILNQ